MQPWRDVDRRDDPGVRGIGYIENRGSVRRGHVPDIGVVPVHNDLAAAGDIDPGYLANAGTLSHPAFLRSGNSTDLGFAVRFARRRRVVKPVRMRDSGRTGNMRIGASTFIWVSPFSSDTLDLIDKVKAFGFDLIEICVEDPDTIDTAVIGRALKRAGLDVTVCGAFGPNRDMSSDDPAVRDNAIGYSRRCVDIAAELGSEVVVGPMYAAVGNTRLLAAPARRRQWDLAVDSVSQVADHAAERGIKLAVEPLNRFETDLINTVDQGLELLSDIGRENVGFLLDTFHMNTRKRIFRMR